ncbi:GH3 auxin-responsive promoter family protein [Eisenibacter elegans]|jgi:hypothetical protein|uniref:GH3 auxin-responsive promoter family protein n=1 Tax=Eisenibacter elegans TaxID=997 RepID=UPI0004793FD7|nr:GH3 auxin-responsive promoter family protein [Eisenibacter elegans]
MKLLNTLIKKVLKQRLTQIEHFMRHPHEVQERTRRQLVALAANTEWGKRHRYEKIRHYEQFQAQVPVMSYEETQPYIRRMMMGEKNILWPSQVRWFAKSSGTTDARSKFIPVSRESMETSHFRGGRDVLALYIHNNPKTKFFWGKGLSIGGTFQVNPENPKTYYGDVSGVIMQNLPQWAQLIRTPPVRVATLEKWEEKIEAMVRVTMQQNVTSILGVPTWTIVLLERMLEITGKKNIREVWPGLEVFIHGAVAFHPYRQYFDSLIQDSDMRYMETYNASEGFFGLQDDLSRDDMLLMLDYGTFYEFVPIQELDSPYPSSLTLSEVELGVNYAMLISTNAGLWRYKIGDTVKFTSKNPYRIKITGRTKHFINAFGEELIIENAEVGIAKACEHTGAIISNFTAAPIYMSDRSKGGHEWVIEFEREPEDLEIFTHILDKTLREVNSDYDAKRYQDMALLMPTVHSVPSGTFYEWLRRRGKLGGQHKVPRLSNNREYIDEILSQLNWQD